jgi:hypothetical protein
MVLEEDIEVLPLLANITMVSIIKSTRVIAPAYVTGQDDIVCGTPVLEGDFRMAGVEDIAGFCINIVSARSK